MDGSVKPLELNTTFDSYDELKESVAHYENFENPNSHTENCNFSIRKKQ